MHGRVVRPRLCLCKVEHLAVKRPAALAGAAVEGRYEAIPLYPRLVVRLRLSGVRDIGALGAHDSPRAERVHPEPLAKYPRRFLPRAPRKHTHKKLLLKPRRHAVYVPPYALRVVAARPVGAQYALNVPLRKLREPEPQPRFLLNAENLAVVAFLRDVAQRRSYRAVLGFVQLAALLNDVPVQRFNARYAIAVRPRAVYSVQQRLALRGVCNAVGGAQALQSRFIARSVKYAPQ